MSPNVPEFGLVFSGGGARGAYEVGVAQYLASQNLVPSAYAGASIGALNAVFLAGAPSFQDGVSRLEDIWQSLRIEKIVKVNKQLVLFGLVHAAVKRGMLLHPELAVLDEALALLTSRIKFMKDVRNISKIIAENPLLVKLQQGVLDNGYLRGLLEEELGTNELVDSSPIWVSAYPSKGAARDILDYLFAGAGIRDTDESHYLLLNELHSDNRLPAILASASIPGVYGHQMIDGQKYVDGGMGSAMSSRGNTPLTPLVQAGYRCCIVVHLSDGAMFNRHDFPDTTIIEVRPAESLHPGGMLPSTFDFRPERIQTLIRQGYSDAQRCIGQAFQAISLVHAGKKAARLRNQSLEQMRNDGFDEAMKLLD
ncbi:patatin-like phospholipase family protein [Paenibacillus azoreducens]|uniref:patatin-like phospholipase family protein n=1 Tax=Paenibacillus azoreducens TaxID=116718 RepID=UPI0039F557C5